MDSSQKEILDSLQTEMLALKKEMNSKNGKIEAVENEQIRIKKIITENYQSTIKNNHQLNGFYEEKVQSEGGHINRKTSHSSKINEVPIEQIKGALKDLYAIV
eukprot:GFUD01067841.1.p1 GENE.GFUD01067841.1~~GFUD01067841.1.p1  ORF type:complete len:103 (+),score=24.37 GFUD01067841.1:31-339(+)